MRSFALLSPLLALANTAVTTPLTPRQDSCSQSGDYVFKIDDIYVRKLDGVTASSVSFNILATNGGTLNFTCTPHDASGNAVAAFEEKKFFSCGTNSFFSFSFQSDRSGLLLKQDVSDRYACGSLMSVQANRKPSETLVGTGTLPTYCHAGGSSASDMVCSGVAPACLTMVQYPN